MSLPRALLVSLRPHQWTKNLVVLAALAFSKHLFDGDAVASAAMAFVVFCALSGAAYLVNDIVDLERDRLHPLKRARPIASGALPVPTARAAAALLLALGLPTAWGLGPGFFACALAYLALNLAYSFVLKDVVILDVLAIALGFVVRAVAGALAIQVAFSDWLLVLHDPPRAVPGPRQATARAGDARRTRWATARRSPSTARTFSTR